MNDLLEGRISAAFEHVHFDQPVAAITGWKRSEASTRRLRLVSAIAIPAAALFAIVLLVGREAAAPSSAFASWQAVPSIEDPHLAEAARSSCVGTNEATLLIQDQRGSAAAFMYRSGDSLVSCAAGFDGNGQIVFAGSAWTRNVDPRSDLGVVSISRAGASSDEGEGLTRVVGELPPAASAVEINLSDGNAVAASISDDWFLGWWPSIATIASITARDSAGAVIATVMTPEEQH